MEQITLEPIPSILIESLRDIGYSFNSALADIVDNSISANASNVWIQALPIDSFCLAVIDDGNGLFREDLKQAMRLGSSDPRQKRALNDLGRFGLGLKTASFSQCRRLTVASVHKGEQSAFTWDLDLVVENNRWTVLERDDFSEIPFIEQLGDSGTLVLWEKVDRLTGSRGSGRVNYQRIISEAQDYLALVFHRFLAGEAGLERISITVNNRDLEPIDPFNSKHKATQISPAELVCPNVTMQAFTLPHKSFYVDTQEYEKYGLKDGYLKNQGVYLYRSKRLILYGTWFGIAKKTALTQLTRVKIDIDINQDELWKIDVKKVSAQLPEAVRDRLKTLINTIGAPSRKTYRRRARKLTSPDVYPSWIVEQDGNRKIYKINREHPLVADLCDELDADDEAKFNSVLSLIEATFPMDSLLYDYSNNEESVSFECFDDDSFSLATRDFFGSLKQQGLDEDTILSVMKSAEPFASNWDAVLKSLSIEEA